MGFNDINLQVSGPQQPASTYKTKVLKGQVPFATQVTEPNTKYVIKHNFVLNGDVAIPENCILEFDGGSISGGNVKFTDTIICGAPKINNQTTNVSGNVYDSTGNKVNAIYFWKTNKVTKLRANIWGDNRNGERAEDFIARKRVLNYLGFNEFNLNLDFYDNQLKIAHVADYSGDACKTFIDSLNLDVRSIKFRNTNEADLTNHISELNTWITKILDENWFPYIEAISVLNENQDSFSNVTTMTAYATLIETLQQSYPNVKFSVCTIGLWSTYPSSWIDIFRTKGIKTIYSDFYPKVSDNDENYSMYLEAFHNLSDGTFSYYKNYFDTIIIGECGSIDNIGGGLTGNPDAISDTYGIKEKVALYYNLLFEEFEKAKIDSAYVWNMFLFKQSDLDYYRENIVKAKGCL